MMKNVALMGSAALIVLGLATPASAQFRAALGESKAAVQEGERSQQTIENLDDQTSALLGDYRANLKQRDVLRRFNASRAREVENQLAQIRGLEQDVENIQGLQRAVLPLLEEMIENIERFVANDTPFLMKERNERLARLRRVMADSTQTAAARYNLILEAYQIENEYGRTIESYKDIVQDDELGELTVEFLRLGRIMLIYVNADGSILRIYNPTTRQYEDLDKGKYLDQVRKSIRVANETAPPDLLELPVTAPVKTATAQ